MQDYKAYVLPGVAALVLLAYFVWRSTADPIETDPPSPPATKAAGKVAATPDRDRGSEAQAKTQVKTDTDADAKTPPQPPEAALKAAARDRQRRDALRAKIQKAQRARTRTPAAEAPDEQARGKLDEDYIQARIKDDLLPLAEECYELAREEDPALGGTLVLEFTIVGEPDLGGIVEETGVDPRSTITHPDMVTCMQESMMSLSFAPPEDGGSVLVRYPFEFRAEP